MEAKAGSLKALAAWARTSIRPASPQTSPKLVSHAVQQQLDVVFVADLEDVEDFRQTGAFVVVVSRAKMHEKRSDHACWKVEGNGGNAGKVTVDVEGRLYNATLREDVGEVAGVSFEYGFTDQEGDIVGRDEIEVGARDGEVLQLIVSYERRGGSGAVYQLIADLDSRVPLR